MYQSIRHRRHTRIFNKGFLSDPAQEDPIFTDLKAILFIMKAMGLFPIFKRISYYEVASPSGSNEYYSYFARGVVHATTVLNLYAIFGTNVFYWAYSKSGNDISNKLIEIILKEIAFSATVIVSGLNFETYLKIINDVLEIDQELYMKFRTVVPQNNCKVNKFLIGIGIWQSYVIIWKILDQSHDHSLAMTFLIGFFLVQNGIITICTVFVSSLLHIIAMRFSYLNLLLTHYTYNNIPWNVSTSRPIKLFDALMSTEAFPENSIFIFRMHSKLLQIYRTTNDCINLIVLTYMGYAFYTLTENTYYLFVESTTQNYLSVGIISWGFAWIVLHWSLLKLVCRSCGLATHEANTIKLLLARVYDDRRAHRNIIDKFLIKSIKQKAQLTAYGFFVIDISTLFKIFCAMTTYLVILFQFKQLEESKINEESK